MAKRYGTLEIMVTMRANNLNMFWQDKRVLITGHSGFKGSWLTLLLSMAGAKITGTSLHPSVFPNLYQVANLDRHCNSNFFDIREKNKLEELIKFCKPEVVFHLAAQPIVQESYRNPGHTYSVNTMGTVNILEILKDSNDVKSIVVITTDKVYKKKNDLHPFTEDDSLGGDDPYSASKSAVELIVQSYQTSFFERKKVGVATARAGNIVGGGDWSENRLIPDLIRSWVSKNDFIMRNPNSIRPWQYMLDSIYGYCLLAKKIYQITEFSGPYNFGPNKGNFLSVNEIVKISQKYLGNLNVVTNHESDYMPESDWLTLDASKSKSILNFNSIYDLETTLQKSIDWYKSFYLGENMSKICEKEIEEYTYLQGNLSTIH
jgi:CDP-glucose 4,6-dehydratase